MWQARMLEFAIAAAALFPAVIGQSYPADGDGWILVARQRSHTRGGRFWPADAVDVSPNDPSQPLFSSLESLENHRYNGRFVFKLVYPGMCSEGGLSQVQIDACGSVQNREYNIWSQTSNPLQEVNSAAGYNAIEIPYPGGDGRNFGGLSRHTTSCSLLQGVQGHGNWNFAVGMRCNWNAFKIPGMVTTGGYATRATQVELFVWAPVANNCPPGQFNVIQGEQYVCRPLTRCVQDVTYETQAPTNITDRECSPVSTCDEQSEFIIEPPTLVDDRQCQAVTECTPFQYENAPPTTTTDRHCVDRSVCTAPYQYEAFAATLTSDSVCLSVTECSSRQYELRSATVTTDRTCAYCAPGAGVVTSDARSCAPARTCTASEYRSAWSDGTSDTVCSRTSTCRSPDVEIAPATSTTDTICMNARICDSNLEEDGTPCTEKCTPCQSGQAIQSACTANSDRTCASINAAGDGESNPSIQASGADIQLSPGRNGRVKVMEGLLIGDVDVATWMESLQREIEILRSALITKDQLMHQRLAELKIDYDRRLQILEQQGATSM